MSDCVPRHPCFCHGSLDTLKNVNSVGKVFRSAVPVELEVPGVVPPLMYERTVFTFPGNLNTFSVVGVGSLLVQERNRWRLIQGGGGKRVQNVLGTTMQVRHDFASVGADDVEEKELAETLLVPCRVAL